MKSLFAKYKEERESAIVVENEHGFASAKLLDDFFYIEDIYVVPEKRQSKIASQMADDLVIKAKELGYNKVLGSVCVDANNSTISLKVLLAYGFSLHHTNNNMIYLIKEI